MAYHDKGEISPMSVALEAREWTREIEVREARRTGVPVTVARQAVARKISTTPSALEHVSRGRAKRIAHDLYDRIRRHFIQELSREIASAEHQIHIARQRGIDPRCDEMAALEAGAKAARALIGGGK